MDGYQVPGIYELVIIKCVYFCIFTKVPGTPCGFKKKHHPLPSRSWLSLSFQVLSDGVIPEATRFIKGLASEAEAVKAKVSVANMAPWASSKQPSRRGVVLNVVRFCMTQYTIHKWRVRVYVPIHEFGWFFVVKLVGTYTVYQSHGWYGLITRNWN